LLHPDDPQHVQGVEVHRHLRKDVAVDALRLRELATLVMADGALEFRRNRCDWRTLSWGFPGAVLDHWLIARASSTESGD
jgi:hypothetical protein